MAPLPRSTELPSRARCPCCGYPTLTSRAYYEICELCWWEDEPLDDETEASVANHGMTLSQARENFRTHGVMYDPAADPRLSGPDGPRERAIKQALIADFEALATAEPGARQAIAARIDTHERHLREILHGKLDDGPDRRPLTPTKTWLALLVAVLLAISFYTAISHGAPPLANMLVAAVVLLVALAGLAVERIRARRAR
ncbi:MAG: hypothetical protein IPK07_18170 [Deltaproteobacteria bacterium]|jgi:hypothetical protein|nr:hypothetical protein [Deltaproteobacteria bacterium]